MLQAWTGKRKRDGLGPQRVPSSAQHQQAPDRAMAMGLARLVPGVHDQRGAELAMQIVLTTLEERRTHRAKPQAQEGAFVVQDEGMKGMRDRPHRLEVRRGKSRSVLLGHPLGRGPRLILGTVAIPARALRLARQAARRTPLRRPPELGRATGEECLMPWAGPRSSPSAADSCRQRGGSWRRLPTAADRPPGGRSPCRGQPTTGGIASRRDGTGQVVRASQQLAGAVDCGQVLPSEMQISGRCGEAPVAE